MKIYIDGEYFAKEQAKISVYDHGLLYGDGVFEGLRIYNGRVFRLDQHLERLCESASAILLEVPLGLDELRAAVLRTVELNGKENGYIRLIITRGVGSLGISPVNCARPSLIIIVDDIQLYPAEYYEQGLSLVTASTRRISADCLDPRIKSLNYLNNIMAKLEARQAGCMEAIMLNRNGNVAECTGDNIFYIKGEELVTPASTEGALAGITRDAVMELAPKVGLQPRYAVVTRHDLYSADECFMTGTAAEIMPVTTIDGRHIGQPGRYTKLLREEFFRLVG